MNHKKKRPILFALAAALPLTAGLVFAAGTSSTPPSTPPNTSPLRLQPAQPGQGQPGTTNGPRGQATPQQRQSSRTNYEGVFLQKLAAQLGISVERLRAAAVAAGSATIDQGVRAGDIPSDRAAGMKRRLQQNPFGFGGPRSLGRGGHHHRDQGGGRRGMDGGPRGFSQPGDQENGGSDDTSGT